MRGSVVAERLVRGSRLSGALLASLLSGNVLASESVVLEPAQDNTLYESALDQNELLFELSNGAGNFLFAGRTAVDGGFKRRRALLLFDLESGLPAGAEIQGAWLELYQSKATPGSPPAVMGLHRVLQVWGEGASQAIPPEGQGDFAQTGDATWHHRLYPTDLWDTAGGSFAESPSAEATVGQLLEDYQWACNQDLLADLRYWQENPAANFGWIVVGGDFAGGSAHRFNSREYSEPTKRPRLTIIYQLADTDFEDGFEDAQSCP